MGGRAGLHRHLLPPGPGRGHPCWSGQDRERPLSTSTPRAGRPRRQRHPPAQPARARARSQRRATRRLPDPGVLPQTATLTCPSPATPDESNHHVCRGRARRAGHTVPKPTLPAVATVVVRTAVVALVGNIVVLVVTGGRCHHRSHPAMRRGRHSHHYVDGHPGLHTIRRGRCDPGFPPSAPSGSLARCRGSACRSGSDHGHAAVHWAGDLPTRLAVASTHVVMAWSGSGPCGWPGSDCCLPGGSVTDVPLLAPTTGDVAARPHGWTGRDPGQRVMAVLRRWAAAAYHPV